MTLTSETPVRLVAPNPLPWPVKQRPFAEALLRAAPSCPEMVVLTADVMRWTDTSAFAEAYPDRFYNLGMAEQNLVGVGSGMARSGLFPVIVTYGVFATRRAYDQIAMGLCTGGVRALIVGFLPGIVSRFKATHQALDDVALMRALPGMSIIDPADGAEMEWALEAALAGDGPVYLRAQRGNVADLFSQCAAADRTPWRARLVARGDDVGVISSGLGTCWALEAAAVLRESGLEAGVLHVPAIKPLDESAVLGMAQRFSILHVVENHSVIGGLTSAVCEVIAQLGLQCRVVPHGVPDRWAEFGRLDHNRRMFGQDADGLAASFVHDHRRRES